MLTKEQIKQVAFVADEWLDGPIKGIVLSFHGLGWIVWRTEPDTMELAWAQGGGLVVFPYYGPWSWMNREAREFIDELIESLYKAYNLPDSTPLIMTGGSMGGFSALLYSRYAKRPVKACLAVMPPCDLVHSMYERTDRPRTLLAAFRHYHEDLDSVLREHSPLHQVDHMPDIPYLFVHGEADTGVPKVHHSDPMVAAMRKRGLNVEYIQVPRMGHDGPVPVEVMQREADFVRQFLR